MKPMLDGNLYLICSQMNAGCIVGFPEESFWSTAPAKREADVFLASC
jgi:hypothetical protein